ncbi:uncharacterized protein I206_100016 [Kwoniella pini CBS 10737]|uniref:Xylanolytic transcriptional activator regulatory domain-containing protein n=1 Tax=Kwoniella pini CBS 10737 TaxID=1296096 RepID=A0A1B9HSB7_9TREE|nr:uncharacterized protein I206_07831 [Kwoniella pini CBS 10737]OCF46161.1 hypothetical protein I206_07831 [Kwoniella pini CBS 10737]
MIRDRLPSPTSSNDHTERRQVRVKRSRAVLVSHVDHASRQRQRIDAPMITGEDKARAVIPTSTDQSINAGPGPTTLESRLSRLEDRLHGVDILLSKDQNPENRRRSDLYKRAVDDDTEWSFLLSQLPPRSTVYRLIRQYFILDTLNRYTHAPSYEQHLASLYANNSDHVNMQLSTEQAPYLASLCLAMVIGSKADQEGSSEEDNRNLCELVDRLSYLHKRFSHFSAKFVSSQPQSADPKIAYYHLHSLMLRLQEAIYDSSSSLPETWFEMGEVFHAALFLRFHQDPDELSIVLSPFWKEMRRRMWYLIYCGEKITTSKLVLPSMLPLATVRRPVLVPDDELREDITQSQLDDRTFVNEFMQSNGATMADLTPPNMPIFSNRKSTATEWAFIDAKISNTQLLCELSRILPQSSQNIHPPDIQVIDNIVDRFDDKRPGHFSLDLLANAQSRDSPLTAPDRPAWICAQACVQNIGIATAVLQAYQPYLSIPTSSYDVAKIVQHALDRSLEAAHRLLVAAEVYVWHITFRWPEGKCLFSWNLGSRLFSAGALVALAAIRDGKEHPSWRGWMGDLKAAEGLLRVVSDHTSKDGQGRGGSADLKALRILRQLSDQATGQTSSSAQSTDSATPVMRNSYGQERIFDPYTSHEMRNISVLSNDPSSDKFEIPETFTLEDLEALLTQVYGKPRQ